MDARIVLLLRGRWPRGYKEKRKLLDTVGVPIIEARAVEEDGRAAMQEALDADAFGGRTTEGDVIAILYKDGVSKVAYATITSRTVRVMSKLAWAKDRPVPTKRHPWNTRVTNLESDGERRTFIWFN